MPKQKKSARKLTTKRSQYKVTNWKEYNLSLKKRASITLWFSQDAIEIWNYKGKRVKGGQLKYSDQSIEICCMIRKVYGLPLRQTEGFLGSQIF